MAKNNETVGWDMDWTDVDETPASAPTEKPGPPAVAKLAAAPVVEAKAVAKPATPPPTQEKPKVASAAETAGSSSSVRGSEIAPHPRTSVSLAKTPAIPGPEKTPVRQAPLIPARLPNVPPAQPPPLPVIRKPSEAASAVLQPPPLPKVEVSRAPEQPIRPSKAAGEPSAAAKIAAPPARKPPGGISSIFTQGQTEKELPATDEISAKSPPKPKSPPGLGPAFARNGEEPALED